jgi:iron complex transport system substrate-binding protein
MTKCEAMGSSSEPPRTSFRLVSLVPSLTETLCHFGLQEQVVGCTSFCTHPLSLRHTAKAVGGTKDARVDDVVALAPTHVFVNTEENPPMVVAELRARGEEHGFLVHESFPRTVIDALEMVEDLGRLLGFEAAALSWRAQCESHLATLARHRGSATPMPYAYFIWRDPWMVAGSRTYIADLLAHAGLSCAFDTSDDPRERYPITSPSEAVFASPDLALLFSSEPFPFRQRHVEEFLADQQAAQGHRARVALKVDGRLASWYGYSTLPALASLLSLQKRISS